MVFGAQQPIVWFCASCHLNKPPRPERTLMEVVMLFMIGKMGR